MKIHLPTWERAEVLFWMDVVKLVLLVVLSAAFVNFNVKLSQTVASTKSLTTQTHTLTLQNQELSKENSKLLQSQQSGIDSVHEQINCVLTFFSQAPTTRPNSSISSSQPCVVTPDGSSGGATGATKSTVNETPTSSGVATNNSAGSAPAKTAPAQSTTPSPSQTPAPAANPGILKKIVDGITGLL
jgi:hypothetical protein